MAVVSMKMFLRLTLISCFLFNSGLKALEIEVEGKCVRDTHLLAAIKVAYSVINHPYVNEIARAFWASKFEKHQRNIEQLQAQPSGKVMEMEKQGQMILLECYRNLKVFESLLKDKDSFDTVNWALEELYNLYLEARNLVFPQGSYKKGQHLKPDAHGMKDIKALVKRLFNKNQEWLDVLNESLNNLRKKEIRVFGSIAVTVFNSPNSEMWMHDIILKEFNRFKESKAESVKAPAEHTAKDAELKQSEAA